MKKPIHRILFLFALISGNYLQPQSVQAETVNNEQSVEAASSQDSEERTSITESQESQTISSESIEESASSSIEESQTTSTESSEERPTETSESMDEVLDRKPASIVNTQTYEDSWAVVNNVKELQKALERKEAYIKFAESAAVFDFGNAAIPITANVTIDGNHRNVAYNGGTFNLNKGLYTTTSGLTIKLQNMTFGSSGFNVPAVGLYGIMQSEKATNLHVENVNYYSDRGAQPFYLRHQNSKIFFHKVNCFTQQKANGSTAEGQEFAEGNHFIFESGSRTTIIQNTNDTLGMIWSRSKVSGITLNEGAEVNITTNHNFIYSDGGNNGAITLGKNAKLSVKGTNSSKGNFYYFDNPATWAIGEQAEFSLNYPNSLKIDNGSAIRFMKGSIGDFVINNSQSVFDREVGSNSVFEINSAKRLKFQAKSGTSYDPIGFLSGYNRFFFHPFEANTRGYQVIAKGKATTNITPQRDAGSWNTDNKGISRSVQQNTPDFTANEKRILKEANIITLDLLNAPVKLTQVAKDVRINDADFQISEYQLNGNEDKYQRSEFKLYDQKSFDPAAEGAGFVEAQQAGNLNDKVTFANLKERTDYWLYVRIVCDPDSQSSEWLEVPFTTQAEMINVSFPVEVAFHTKKEKNQQKVTEAENYSIDNHSSFPVKVQAQDFKELSNPSGIHLLPEADEKNQKDLFLKLTEGERTLGVLTEKLNEAPQTFKDLAGKTSTTFGFSGNYYGNPKKAQQIQYQLTLTAERKD